LRSVELIIVVVEDGPVLDEWFELGYVIVSEVAVRGVTFGRGRTGPPNGYKSKLSN